MIKITLCKGIPASGKSTWAKKQVEANPKRTIRINKDDMRDMFNMGHWNKNNEKFILKVRDQSIVDALESGYKHIIIDDTNLHPKHLERVKEIVSSIKTPIKVEEKLFEVELEEAIKRDLQREKTVGEKVIKMMWKQLYPNDPINLPQAPPIVAYDKDLPDCVICDLDGTLALFKFPDGTSTRSPFNASKCYDTDMLNMPVYNIITMYHNIDMPIILLSGRSSKYRNETIKFLEKYNVEYNGLFMRKEGDDRKDSIIKKELWEENIKGKYNVHLVLDDRDQMIELWRNELGFTTFQVANGNF
jgi:predicted kinase